MEESMDAQKQARADELVEELANLLAEAENQDGSFKTFDQMEIAANKVGDQVSERLAQKSLDHSLHKKTESPRCPKCDQPGCRLEDPDPRVIQTSRGEVQWNEDEYFCRKCRRAFFPSDGSLGIQG
jgi:uncharacterized protein with PIN domain